MMAWRKAMGTWRVTDRLRKRALPMLDGVCAELDEVWYLLER